MRLIPLASFPAQALSECRDHSALEDFLVGLSSSRIPGEFGNAVTAIADAAFPLLASVDVAYLEIRDSDVAASGLSDWDQQVLRKTILHGDASHLATWPPLVIVAEGLLAREDFHEKGYIIIHELVHVEQRVRGDLVYDEEERLRWKGEDVTDRMESIGAGLAARDTGAQLAYLELPWEAEAHQRTNGLEWWEAEVERLRSVVSHEALPRFK